MKTVLSSISHWSDGGECTNERLNFQPVTQPMRQDRRSSAQGSKFLRHELLPLPINGRSLIGGERQSPTFHTAIFNSVFQAGRPIIRVYAELGPGNETRPPCWSEIALFGCDLRVVAKKHFTPLF